MRSKVMEERIRRTKVVFAELNYRIIDSERSKDSFSATFEDDEGFQGGLLIDHGCRFLELAYSFTFSPSFSSFLKERLEEMLRICYDFGCYVNLQKDAEEISFSVFTKLYYAGLTYASLKDTLRDFHGCVNALTELLNIEKGSDLTAESQ